jgi:KDO2-lipid IV(A) lauroyltransferase
MRLKSNLARVRPDLTEKELELLTRAGMRSYMRYWCEAFRLPTYSPNKINETFELRGKEILDATLNQGNGAIMIPGHMANWDLAGAWATQRYGALTTVAEQLKPKDLFDQFLEYRESLGMEVLPLGEPDVMRSLLRRLREGRLVALLGDRDLTSSGVIVDFFGGKASFPAGPALLSIMTGAPLHPVTMHNEGHQTVGVVYPRVEVPELADRDAQVSHMTQQIARAFEVGIAEHPEDWHMLQRVWLD